MISEAIQRHLKDIQDTNVSSLGKEALLINPEHTVAQVIHELDKNNEYDAFYYNGKSVFVTNLRSLLAGKDIADMKIEPFLFPIPPIKPTGTIQEASDIMSHYRIRTVPILENDKISRAIHAKSILNMLSKKDNRWITANQIFTKNPVTVSSKDSLATARKIMLTKKIDHLPVIHKDSVRQVLTSYHVTHAITLPERLGKKALGMKKIRTLESPIGNMGSTRIPQCTPNDDLNSILDAMLKTDTTCCLVTLWDNLQGIITYRDILNLLSVKQESEIPLYFVGLPPNPGNTSLITKKFANTLKKLQKAYSEILEARVSVRQERSGSKKEGKYEVSVMVISAHHSPYIYKEIGFDLSKTMDALSQKLLRNLSKKAKRRNKISVRKIGLPVSPA